MTLLNTGMTRDGLFLIENGEIVGAGAELPLERIAGGQLQQHHDARAVRCRCTRARPTTIPGTALVPAMKLEDFTMTSISPAV